ncbi:MAG: GNAT family N-acetyltransferase [Planctomycetota bacterium]
MPITHNANTTRFLLPLDNADDAYLLYEPLDPNSCPDQIAFISVYVPESHRGQGFAAQLADVAFAHARAASWTVHPVCPYLRAAYLPRNPQHADLLAG